MPAISQRVPRDKTTNRHPGEDRDPGAVGSANELDTQLEISKATRMVDVERVNRLQTELTRVTMMLRGLIRALKAKR